MRPGVFLGVALATTAVFAAVGTRLALRPQPPVSLDDLRAPPGGKAMFQGARIDEPTLALFRRACQDCHSENTRWPWYSRVPPGSWMVGQDVNDARRHVLFSNWESYSPNEQKEFLTRIGNEVRTGLMPLPRYTLLHRDAVLAPEEQRQIYGWTRAEKKRLHAASSSDSPSTMGAPSAQSSSKAPN